MTIKKILPIHPGEILSEDFIKPLNITQYRLAKDIGVSATRIGQIISGKRSITPETDLRLCTYFELNVGYWLRIQNSYDIEIERRILEEKLMDIVPFSELNKLSHI